MEFLTCSDFLYDLFLSDDANIVLYLGNEKAITIPDTFDGHKVTTIGGFAFSGMEFIESIVIPDSIDEICAGAFERCSSLKHIHIPASVVDIDNSAFSGCSALELIVVSGSKAHLYAEQHRLPYRFEE